METKMAALRRPAPLLALPLLLAGLAGCGSSSPQSKSTPSASVPLTASSSIPLTVSSSSTASASITPGSGTACQRLLADLQQAPQQLASAAADPSKAGPQVNTFVSRLKQDAASGPAPLKSAVETFAAQIQQAVKDASGGKVPDISALTKQATGVAELCSGSGASSVATSASP